MIKTFEEFESYYLKNGKTPNMMSKPKNSFNDKQLNSKWESYQKSFKKEKKIVGKAGDEKWDEVCLIVRKRDYGQCRLLSKLKVDKPEAYEYILSTYPFTEQLDMAHVISRTSSKNLYYDPENIVLLCRLVHSRLDQYLDPITGKSITKAEREGYFRYIIGDETYENLILRK